MSAALTKFVPKVAVEVAECPRPVMIDAIRQACIDFCVRSNAWKEWLDPIVVSSTERAIEVEHPDKARIIKVLDARFTDVDDPLSLILPSKANELYPGWDIDLEGTPEALFLRSPDEIRLCPHPDTDGDELTLEATLRPSEDSVNVGDILWTDHAQVIADGAKARLMQQVNVPWHNPGRAAQLQTQFESAANSLNVAQAVGYTTARLRTTLENR